MERWLERIADVRAELTADGRAGAAADQLARRAGRKG
jgi:hypothetical protein